MKKISKAIIEAAVVIAVVMSLCISSTAVTNRDGQTNPKPLIFWEDNFDSYTTGQVLDGTPDDGGWKGWDDNPAAGSTVVDTQAQSTPNSVEIVGDSDLVHEYSGAVDGQWTYTAWQYIPEDFVGNSYFILLSDYTDGAGDDNSWTVQVRFDSDNQVVESEFDTVTLPLITGSWVEIRVEIDLDADSFTFFYDNDELITKAWTATPNNDGTGILNIAAVDLFAYGSTAVYYDDMSLDGEATPQPVLEITDITGGIGVGATITNTGEAEATDVNWEIHITGGILGLIDKTATGTISSIDIGAEEAIASGLFIGLGTINIEITTECAEGASADATASGTQILIFTMVS